MSSYNGKDDGKMALFGIDGAWKNAKDGTLLDFVEKQNGEPCIVILDEFEKANMEVVLQFLQILESGRTENIFIQGVKGLSPEAYRQRGYDSSLLDRNDYTSFSNVYLFFTTNAGRALYEGGKQPAPDLTKEAIIDAIRKDVNPDTKQSYFPDAILSRFQTGTVVMFRHLDTNELIQIGQKELIKNIDIIGSKYDLKIEIESKVTILLLLKEGGQVDARNFRKIAEAFVRNQITNLGTQLKQEMRNISKVHIGIDPEEKENLNNLMFGEQSIQDVIFVCEDEKKLNLFYEMLKSIDGIKIRKTTDYADAMHMVKEEVFSTPLVFAVLPSAKADESLTMASVNSALQARSMKNFKEFVEKVKKYNEKTVLDVIDLEHSSDETRKDLLYKGVTEIVDFTSAADAPKIIQNKVNIIALNNMAFDFARKGKALKYDIVPVVYDDTAYVRFRFFEKIDNIKSGDDEFLVGQDRMPNVSFDNVVGGNKIKDEASDFISFLKNPKTFVSKGLKAPKGLLFYGPAGTGKTFMAKAIAHEAGVPFIATNGGDIRMGTKEKNGAEILKQYFAIARKYAPSILFIDEMETIALNRTGADPGADTIVNELLAEMDGFDGHDSNPVVVIGATNAGIDRENHVDGRFLDSAVVRRFTRKFFVDLPCKEDRLEYLMRSLIDKDTKLPIFTKEELETAAQMSQGLSFGYMNNAIEIAKRLAVRENRNLNKADVENAVETVNYGEARERNAASKERTAYHEAGHACIGCILGGVYMPDHATIVSRGDFGGYVSTAGDEKGMTCSKEYIENCVRTALAGRCAEVIHYGEYAGLTDGPSSDIESAYRYIFEMVCHLGMDEEIGMTYYANSNDGKYVQLPQIVQERINVLFKKYYEETMQMLKEHSDMFEAIAKSLLKNESLGKKELEVIAEKYNG
jgi:ATP-dependent Zn protease